MAVTDDNRLAMVILSVDDVEKAASFYQSVFGWPRRIESPAMVELALPDGRGLGLYYWKGFGGNTGRLPSGVKTTSGTELYVQCADLDGCIGRLRSAGARLLADRSVKPWGDEVAYFADLDGNVVAVSAPAGRKEPTDASPIVIEASAMIYAPVQEVYQAWTTVEGVRTFFAPDATIELAENGAYEMNFMPGAPEGSRGSEGCKVIAFEADRHLAVTWNFPPSLPALRHEFTRVDIEFTATSEDITEVTIRHSGFRPGVQWARGVAYFEQAWDLVLYRLNHRFRFGAVNWEHPPTL